MVELLHHYWNTRLSSNKLLTVLGVARLEQRVQMPAKSFQVQRRLDEAQTADLVEAYRTGAGVKELAHRFGVHRHTVAAILQRSGIPCHPRGLSPDQLTTAQTLYKAGWSLARLGEKLGVDGTTVWRALVQAGVRMRPASQSAR